MELNSLNLEIKILASTGKEPPADDDPDIPSKKIGIIILYVATNFPGSMIHLKAKTDMKNIKIITTNVE